VFLTVGPDDHLDGTDRVRRDPFTTFRNKAAGKGLLKEIWVAGNRFQAEIFVPSKADSLCSIYNMWGHSEFPCYSLLKKGD
jgi:hypothetical protein